MKREHLPISVLGGAILVVGLAVAGVPLGNLVFVLIALACPVMMIFMMSGRHGGHGHSKDRQDQPDERIIGRGEHSDLGPAAGNRDDAYR